MSGQAVVIILAGTAACLATVEGLVTVGLRLSKRRRSRMARTLGDY
jgi:hypothetical protein